MSSFVDAAKGERLLLLGNEAIARGALEAGISVAAAYPGTPSSEILESLAKAADKRNLYVEWSSNEKVSLEVAAAASLAGLRALCPMKQCGLNVAADFLVHLSLSGTRGGLVLVSCDDPGAISSINEEESRQFAKLAEMPMLEPADFQEAKEMVKWAFELSEEIRNLVMVRSVTRLSHATGDIETGKLPENEPRAEFKYDGFILDQMEGLVVTAPVDFKHNLQHEKLEKAAAVFEDSPFNSYYGPEKPELLIITSSVCFLYTMEAIRLLQVEDRVGILKLGTTYPLPAGLVQKHLEKTDRIFIVEEVLPFMEENIKVLAAGLGPKIGTKTFHGKIDGTLPKVGELGPDIVAEALAGLLGVEYEGIPESYGVRAREVAFFGAPNRELTFCPGCPHRASFWSIHHALTLDGRKGFVCGDIGCYGLALLPCGFSTLKTMHAMGSGTGLASGFGKLGAFGMDQPVLSVCGDSTFFHTAMPALVNAIHHRSDITMVVLDNSGTGMTGFQPHPGLPVDARGNETPAIDIAEVCKAMGARVDVADPFDLETTSDKLLNLLDIRDGVKVLVLRQMCALSPEKKGRKLFDMHLDPDVCLGENCGCNRICTRVFLCPGLIWDAESGKARIDEALCSGCGVCASVCPSGAIRKEAA